MKWSRIYFQYGCRVPIVLLYESMSKRQSTLFFGCVLNPQFDMRCCASHRCKASRSNRSAGKAKPNIHRGKILKRRKWSWEQKNFYSEKWVSSRSRSWEGGTLRRLLPLFIAIPYADSSKNVLECSSHSLVIEVFQLPWPVVIQQFICSASNSFVALSPIGKS